VFRIGDQVAETLRLHEGLSARDAHERAVEMLRLVGIPAPEQRVRDYPHQMSGGMRQRVMIAMALACDPRVLIADEPTTALDVTIQAQILELMRRLQAERGMGLVFITHDLGVVAEIADEVAVMYAGRVVERGAVGALFAAPGHPYTRGLLGSAPPVGVARGAGRPRRLTAIDGLVPDLLALGPGCRFADRCALRAGRSPPPAACREAEPALARLPAGGAARCHFPGEVA